MLILMPVNSNDKEKATIALLNDVKQWVLIDFENGKTNKIKFFNDHKDIDEHIEIIIVKNHNEYVLEFEEKNISVLVATQQLYIDDIMEAFIFKELHDYNLSTSKV